MCVKGCLASSCPRLCQQMSLSLSSFVCIAVAWPGFCTLGLLSVCFQVQACHWWSLCLVDVTGFVDCFLGCVQMLTRFNKGTGSCVRIPGISAQLCPALSTSGVRQMAWCVGVAAGVNRSLPLYYQVQLMCVRDQHYKYALVIGSGSASVTACSALSLRCKRMMASLRSCMQAASPMLSCCMDDQMRNALVLKYCQCHHINSSCGSDAMA
ncbi:hypothetical protein COO60DRAFT_276923 [Scenedesmus sp. NREL 46B-D3]|nr:hypothetical protein COO60DRAFT_276923 [Scenedesmus sp. NREL 46B-D3]